MPLWFLVSDRQDCNGKSVGPDQAASSGLHCLLFRLHLWTHYCKPILANINLAQNLLSSPILYSNKIFILKYLHSYCNRLRMTLAQFSMQNTYESCDLGRALWRNNVDVHQ